MKKRKKFKFSLFAMLIMLSVVPLVLSIAVISTMSLYVTKNNLEKESKDMLFIVANNLANYCRENEINAINASNYYDYLDSLKDQNIEMAIIIEGAPCATSIKNENDYRIREIEFEKDFTTDVEEIKNGYYDEYVVIDEKVYYAYYMPIESDNEIIGMAFAGKLQEHVTGAIQSSIISFLGIAVFLIILFSIIVLICSKIFLKSFEIAGKSVTALSKGDLSKQKEYNSFVKEMNTLLIETSTMQGSLSQIIGKVKLISHDLVKNIFSVTALSESSTEKAEQITDAMKALTMSTMEVAENVQDVNVQMLEIGNCVNDISESVEQLHKHSENIVQTNNEAKINMNTILENSQKSVTAVEDIAVQIRETNDSITEIDKAVELILNISEQTNLLSLNASIEAARAGENGRGFAVVAEEIRRLSEQSAEGAEMIKSLASVITEKSEKSVHLTEGIHSLIVLEQDNVSKTQRKYEELSNDINKSVNAIESIAEKTENLTRFKEKIINNVKESSSISEKNASRNEKVNDNVNEIMTEIQKVNEYCEKMNQMARELDESVSYFHD